MKGLIWRLGKDRTTEYAKTAIGDYVVENGWMGWIDHGLYPESGVAWQGGRATRSREVAKRACERHYKRTVRKLLRGLGIYEPRYTITEAGRAMLCDAQQSSPDRQQGVE